MACMRFMSCPAVTPGLTKMFSFDSSPGRAIGQALGAGMWDEKSYRSEFREDRLGDKIYAVFMRRKPPEGSTDEQPEQKVGMITHTPPM